MVVNISSPLKATQEEYMRSVIYIKRAQSSLEALKYPCDCPSRYLYNALSYLSKVPGSGMDIKAYDYLFTSTEDAVSDKDVNEAWQALHTLEEKVRQESVH